MIEGQDMDLKLLFPKLLIYFHEQNHSSFVQFAGKNFSGELEQLLLMLLNRHFEKTLLTNTQLNEYNDSLRIELHQTQQTSVDPILIQAKKH